MQKLYDWMMAKAGQPQALWWLAAISFAESSFFPIPPDVMLVPLILAAPTRWLRICMVCTLASVLGGFFGYAIGYFFMDTVGQAILGMLHLTEKFQALKPLVDEYGVWVIIVKGATPIPYKLITISAGAFHFDLLDFTFASILSRGLRFLLVGVLLWKFGPPIRAFVERRLTLVMTVTLLLVVGGFALVKLL